MRLVANWQQIVTDIDSGALKIDGIPKGLSYAVGTKHHPMSHHTKPVVDMFIARGGLIPWSVPEIHAGVPQITRDNLGGVLRELRRQGILVEHVISSTPLVAPVPVPVASPVASPVPVASPARVAAPVPVAVPVASPVPVVQKPKKILTEDQKAKMKAGREAALARKKAASQVILTAPIEKQKDE
jgi:hypothetical protein